MAHRSSSAWHARWILFARSLAGSYWFVPALMMGGAIALSYAMLWVDQTLIDADPLPWIYEGDASGARAVLAAVGGSMITVGGVVFSITIVALSLASQQFGPLLLRNFMSDRPNQLVLGTFVATFLYCLLILRAVRGGDTGSLPHASVTGAIVLAVVSLGVLIFFIHHIATSIRPAPLLDRIAASLDRATRRTYPERVGAPPVLPDDELTRRLASARVLRAHRDGYVEVIDDEALMRVARERDLLVEVLVRPGDFVLCGAALARVHPLEASDRETSEALLDVLVLGSSGDPPTDDIRHHFDQLVQLCLRALSPSLNDPITARAGTDRMAAALACIARRSTSAPPRFDEGGTLRILARATRFEDLLRQTLDPVRRNAGRQAEVLDHLLDSIDKMEPSVRDPAHRRALRDLVARIGHTARTDLLPCDVAAVLAHAHHVDEELRNPPGDALPRP